MNDITVKTTRDVPIIAFSRWTRVKDDHGTSLMKKFVFVDITDRAEFVKLLMKYEAKVRHAAKMLVVDNDVSLALQTSNINSVTDIDTEYARFADEAYRDIAMRAEA